VKFLLDTHILLWWLDADPLLSEEAIGLIGNPRNTHIRKRRFALGNLAQAEPGQVAPAANFGERLAAESFENLP